MRPTLQSKTLLALTLVALAGCGPTASDTSRRAVKPAPLASPPAAGTTVAAAPTAAASAKPTAPPPSTATHVRPPLIDSMRSSVARGDGFFPDLQNDCMDPNGLTTPLWQESRLAMVVPSKRAERGVKRLAKQAVLALKTGRYDVLAKQVEPTRGLCMRAAKGSGCVQLTRTDVANCRKFHAPDWPIDSGADGPFPGTCHEMVRKLFMARDFTKPTSLSFSCFAGIRGNNGGSIVQPDMDTDSFAEFYRGTPNETATQRWRALRLGYITHAGKPHLTEIISEYWGI